MSYYLRSLLLAEGPTDEVLCPILTWLLEELVINSEVAPTEMAHIPKASVEDRMRNTFSIYDPSDYDIFFFHLDADSVDAHPKRQIILQAYQNLKAQLPITIAVVPVQETEAWLLLDEVAIRKAASNPAGTAPLSLPPVKSIEKTANPKEMLYDILMQANMRHGKNDRHYSPAQATRRIPDSLNFSKLRKLKAFCDLEMEIKTLVQNNQW